MARIFKRFFKGTKRRHFNTIHTTRQLTLIFYIAFIWKSHLSSQILETKLKGRQTYFTRANCT
jgi:uncharacterized membrane protein (DUF485 family)